MTLLSLGVVKVIAAFTQDTVSAWIAGQANVTGRSVDAIAGANGTATAIAEQPNTTVSLADVNEDICRSLRLAQVRQCIYRRRRNSHIHRNRN